MLRFDLLVTMMIDTDLYVLPTIAHYFLDISQGHNRSGAFLSPTATLNNSNNVSYHALLARVFDNVESLGLPTELSLSCTTKRFFAFLDDSLGPNVRHCYFNFN